MKVWLWCRAGILASVAVAQTQSHPWLPDMPHAHSHGAASVWLNVHVHRVDSDFFIRNRRNTVAVFYTLLLETFVDMDDFCAFRYNT